jgi:hypothetical protein
VSPIALRRPTRGRAAVVAALATASVGTGLAVPAASQAMCNPDPEIACPAQPLPSRTGKVAVAKGWTLGVRAVPRPNARQIRQLANGSTVRFVCQRRGPAVSGTFGRSRLWNKLVGGGWVNDSWIYTGSDRRVAPKC